MVYGSLTRAAWLLRAPVSMMLTQESKSPALGGARQQRPALPGWGGQKKRVIFRTNVDSARAGKRSCHLSLDRWNLERLSARVRPGGAVLCGRQSCPAGRKDAGASDGPAAHMPT